MPRTRRSNITRTGIDVRAERDYIQLDRGHRYLQIPKDIARDVADLIVDACEAQGW